MDASDTETVKEQISREKAAERLREAEAELKELRVRRKTVKDSMQPQTRRLRDVKAEIRALKAHIKRTCIEYRNNYSRPAIQEQFAEGIRE